MHLYVLYISIILSFSLFVPLPSFLRYTFLFRFPLSPSHYFSHFLHLSLSPSHHFSHFLHLPLSPSHYFSLPISTPVTLSLPPLLSLSFSFSLSHPFYRFSNLLRFCLTPLSLPLPSLPPPLISLFSIPPFSSFLSLFHSHLSLSLSFSWYISSPYFSFSSTILTLFPFPSLSHVLSIVLSRSLFLFLLPPLSVGF